MNVKPAVLLVLAIMIEQQLITEDEAFKVEDRLNNLRGELIPESLISVIELLNAKA